jgi:hypothetical protein
VPERLRADARANRDQILAGSALGGEYILDPGSVTAHARVLGYLRGLALSPSRTAWHPRGEPPRGQRTPPGETASA